MSNPIKDIMKYIFYCFFCFCILACEETIICENSECHEVTEYPVCFMDFVDQVLSKETKTPRAGINSYSYEGDTVYVADKGGAPENQGIHPVFGVFDSSCNLVCELDFVLKENNPNFCMNWDQVVLIETIWQDPR